MRSTHTGVVGARERTINDSNRLRQGGTAMQIQRVVLSALLMGSMLGMGVREATAGAKDEAAIRALAQRFAAAVKAKDVNALMQVYVPDDSLVVFDVIPPRQYVGAKAYRQDWESLFAAFPGPIDTFEITELHIMTEGTLGVSHSIQHLVLTDKEGQKVDLTVRVTDGYRKRKGKWFITHEHVSVPVDLATGKADLASKP
jgi:uncharacterized protein (TIGR02246 family)